KIVCTLGPATATAPRLAELIDAGMDVARLNFSHSTQTEHSAVYGMVRQIAAERGRAVGVLADLQGPKIRLGRFAAGPVVWAAGEQIVITTAACAGDHDRVSTTYDGLASDVRPGDRLLVDDGKVELRCSASTATTSAARFSRVVRSVTTRAFLCRAWRSAFRPCPTRISRT